MKDCQLLVVDDDKEDQEIISEYLTEAGISDGVLYANNGKEAIELLGKLSSNYLKLPRLIILDLNMPLLGGADTLRILKAEARYNQIPVLIYSTANNEMEKRKCLQYGAVGYLIKPMTYKEGQRLIKVVSEYLRPKTD